MPRRRLVPGKTARSCLRRMTSHARPKPQPRDEHCRRCLPVRLRRHFCLLRHSRHMIQCRRAGITLAQCVGDLGWTIRCLRRARRIPTPWRRQQGGEGFADPALGCGLRPIMSGGLGGRTATAAPVGWISSLVQRNGEGISPFSSSAVSPGERRGPCCRACLQSCRRRGQSTLQTLPGAPCSAGGRG